MTTTRRITNVKVITNIAKPVIVLELEGHPAVVRNPKQMLTDLNNSGRALNVFNTNDTRFAKECYNLIGATLTGELKVFKAGDKYTVTEGHPDVAAGTAKIGDTKFAEKDGVWVEGFLSIPQTMMERQMELNASAYADSMKELLGIFAPAPAQSATTSAGFTPETEDVPANEVVTTAVEGKAAKAGN